MFGEQMKVNIGKWPKNGNDRKVKVEISNHDLWNLDHTLALVIAPSLRAFKGSKQGVPSIERADLPERLRVLSDFDKEEMLSSSETTICSIRAYDWVLDQMIAAFEYLEKDREFLILDDQLRIVRNEHGELELVENTGEKIDYKPTFFGETAEEDKALTRAHYDLVNAYNEEVVQRGFELFGKYFRSLWN
jgi:hypothetical protein